MPAMKRAAFALAGVGLVCAAFFAFAWALRFHFAGPSPALYAARNPPAARVVAAGQVAFDGERFACGSRATVFNPNFSDYGAAFFGFVIINPDRFALLPAAMKRFAYAHECGHQFVGYSELDADCYAVKRGLAQGWLDLRALEEICAFFSKSKGTALHLPGPKRCEAIRSCYAKQTGNP
jgi:hypothetical protein